MTRVDDIANTMLVQIEFINLVGSSTASHIHVINGPGDLNVADTLGPVATTTPAFVGFPTGVPSGTLHATCHVPGYLACGVPCPRVPCMPRRRTSVS